MTFTVTTDQAVLTLKIEGELDAVTVGDLRSALDRIVSEGPNAVVVDLGQLRLIDSSGVGAIVSLYKRLRARGGDLTVKGVRGQPLSIFKLLRLDKVMLA